MKNCILRHTLGEPITVFTGGVCVGSWYCLNAPLHLDEVTKCEWTSCRIYRMPLKLIGTRDCRLLAKKIVNASLDGWVAKTGLRANLPLIHLHARARTFCACFDAISSVESCTIDRILACRYGTMPRGTRFPGVLHQSSRKIESVTPGIGGSECLDSEARSKDSNTKRSSASTTKALREEAWLSSVWCSRLHGGASNEDDGICISLEYKRVESQVLELICFRSST